MSTIWNNNGGTIFPDLQQNEKGEEMGSLDST